MVSVSCWEPRVKGINTATEPAEESAVISLSRKKGDHVRGGQVHVDSIAHGQSHRKQWEAVKAKKQIIHSPEICCVRAATAQIP